MNLDIKDIIIEKANHRHMFSILDVLNKATLSLHQSGIMQWEYPWDASLIAEDLEQNRVFIVRVQDFVIGTFSLISKSDINGFTLDEFSLYLYHLAILPELKGQGVGEQIMNFIKQNALTKKSSLYIDCYSQNPKLISYYESIGFQNVGNVAESDYEVSIFKLAVNLKKITDFDMMENVLEYARDLIAIDSPSGYCMKAIAYVKQEVEKLGFETSLNAKGNLIIYVEGTSEKTIGLCAHVDTLGLMVRSIKGDGTLAFTPIGGPILPTYDGEYCTVYTRDDKLYSATVLSNQTSIHVHKEASSATRNSDTMHIRLDERVQSKSDVEKLGIENGDFIAIDPKFVITETGFIKSRFLDDKISVASLMGILAFMKKNNFKPKHQLKIIISTYEEIGHGSSHIPGEISELIAVDMGCIGDDLSCTEFDVSICAKDSSGPYDYELTRKLINLAKTDKLNYAVDIYPMYGSDVSAALRGGNDIRGTLIGPGVAASHGMERTHIDGVENTIKLILSYLDSE